MSLEKLTGLPVNSVWFIMNFLSNEGYLDNLDIGNSDIWGGKISNVVFREKGIHIHEKIENGSLVYEIEGISPEEFQKIRDRLIDYCMERAKS